jgi:two-component system response regulator AtoC
MRILVIDDEESIRHMLSVVLKKEGYDVVGCADGEEALALKAEDFDFILCDIKMPGMDGKGFLKEFSKRGAPSTVIMMSAYGTVDTAIECMKLGAYDYISKPFKTDEVTLTIKKAEERKKLRRENLRLVEETKSRHRDIYAKSTAMRSVLMLARKVADYDTTVLITGETGTGKELLSRAIHYGGKRKDAPFVALNCGAVPEALLESELFGHIRGAFTDAVRTKEGLFEAAEGGTILLDEVGELPRELQVKLLRALEEGEIRRVGDTRSIKVDARVLAATGRNLPEEVRKGNFREDLYYRLNVVEIKVPPLRERTEDIDGLAALFIERYGRKYGKNIKGVTEDVLKTLLSYRWPGNVRELENIIERAVILEEGDWIKSVNIGPEASTGAGAPHVETFSIKKAESALERELIKRALEQTGGNRTRAAELLEISHRALLYKIKEYGIEE